MTIPILHAKARINRQRPKTRASERSGIWSENPCDAHRTEQAQLAGATFGKVPVFFKPCVRGEGIWICALGTYIHVCSREKIEISRDGGCAMNWALIAWLKMKKKEG